MRFIVTNFSNPCSKSVSHFIGILALDDFRKCPVLLSTNDFSSRRMPRMGAVCIRLPEKLEDSDIIPT